MSTKKELKDADISQYLKEHSDFFVRNSHLLEDIELPHESGSAVSLVERQVSILRERNIDMRHRLSKLLENAKDNDKLFDKTRRLVLDLVESKTVDQAIDAVLRSFSNDFDIPFTTVTLFKENFSQKDSQQSDIQWATLSEARNNIGRIIGSGKTVCGQLPREELQFLFQGNAQHIGSAAVVPLSFGNCFGVLAIGNQDPNYYRSSMGTLFLNYIGEVLNRLLPKYQ